MGGAARVAASEVQFAVTGWLRVAADLLETVGAVVAGLAAIGWLRQSLHRPTPAQGDAELAQLIDQLRSPATRQLALAVVVVGADPTSTRSAFIDCDATTRFEIGSVTKGLTGLLLADAVARKEVDLATPIADYLPALAGSPAGRTTLAQLASHTSGLPRLPWWPFVLTGAAWYFFGTDPYRGQRISRLARSARGCSTPDSGRREYSNLGAALAGQAVASAAGQPYGEIARRRIFAPLRMTETAVDPPVAAPRGWRKHGRRASPWRLGAYAPAAGVVSTSADLARLIEALLTRSAPGVSALVRSDASSAFFWATDTSGGPDRMCIWHNGETGGYAAFCAVYPHTGHGVLALANRADAADLERLVREVSTRMMPRSQDGDHHQ